MIRTRSSYDRSTMSCMLGLAVTGALGACSADGAETASASQPVQVRVTPSQDTWMRRNTGGAVDWGEAHELRTNNVDAATPAEVIFLQFDVDLDTVCPTLANATLSLQTAQLLGPPVVLARRVTSEWISGSSGAVAPAPDCAVFSGVAAPFTPPTFVAPAAATLVNDYCTRFSWNVKQIVQDWCAGELNYGIRLEGHGGGLGEVNFFSMEALIPGRRPVLEINY